MTTITIENIETKNIKTHFSDPLEAGYYLIGLSISTSNHPNSKKTKRELAMEEYERGDIVDGEIFLKTLIASKSQ